jgi:hypothetical protein
MSAKLDSAEHRRSTTHGGFRFQPTGDEVAAMPSEERRTLDPDRARAIGKSTSYGAQARRAGRIDAGLR